MAAAGAGNLEIVQLLLERKLVIFQSRSLNKCLAFPQKYCGATYWRQYFYRILLVLLPYIRSTGAGTTTAAVVLALFPLALDAVVPARHSLSVLSSTRAPLRNPSSGSC